MQAWLPSRSSPLPPVHRRWAARLAWRRRLQWALIAFALLLPLALWVHPAWGLLSLLALLYPSRLELPRALRQLDERYGLAYHSALEAPPAHPWRQRLEAEARQSLLQARLPKLPWLAGGIYLALLGLVWLLPPVPVPGLSAPPRAPAPNTQASPPPASLPNSQPNTPTTLEPQLPQPSGSRQPPQEEQGQEAAEQATPPPEGAQQSGTAPSAQPEGQGASPEEASPSQQGQEPPRSSEQQRQIPQQNQGQEQVQGQGSQGERPGEQVGAGQPDRQGQKSNTQPQGVEGNPQNRQPGRSTEQGTPANIPQNQGQNPQPGPQSQEKRGGTPQVQGRPGQPGAQGTNGQALPQPPSTPNRPLSGEAPLRRSDNPGGQTRNLPDPWRGGQPPQHVQRQVERYLESEPLPPEVRDLLRRYFKLPAP